MSDERAFIRLENEVRRLQARLKPPMVRWKRVGSQDLEPPRYETEGAAGMDLRADVAGMDRVGFRATRLPAGGDAPWRLVLAPGARVKIPCGFAFEIPPGFEGQVRRRSGWTERGVYASHGTVDSDFRGCVGIHMENRSAESVAINQGDRIAQLIIAAAPQARLEEAEELSSTARNAGGFGSTGVR